MKIEIDLNINLPAELLSILRAGVSAVALSSAADTEATRAHTATVAAEPTKPAAAKATKAAKTVAPPADPKPEAQAQDEKDEAAETAAAEEAAKAKAAADAAAKAAAAGAAKAEQEKAAAAAAATGTIDKNSLRMVGQQYADKFGMPACLEDGPKIIGFASFGKVPDDKVPEAYAAMVAAIEQNPYERAPK